MNKNWLLVFLIALLASCSTDVGNFQIGQDLIESESKIIMNDNFAVSLSTILVDSLATSTPAAALIGSYTHPTIGSTELKHYFNVDLASGYSSISEDDDIFDSITVKFSYNKFSIGDTITPVTFSLHRLTQELELIPDENQLEYLYNTSSFNYDPAPLGTYTFVPNPSGDSIEFKLNPTFGQEILNWIWNDDSTLDKNDRFQEMLKGFVMTASETSHVILGFNNSTSDGIQFKLYTHAIELDVTEKIYEFNRTLDGTSFNQVIADRNGSDFSLLAAQELELPSTESNSLTYIQGSSGVLTRIDFPSMNDIFNFSDRVLIKAEIVLVPAIENGFDNLPSSLNFYATGRLNEFSTTNVLATTSSTGASVNITANLVSNVLTDEYYYIANITNYLTTQLSGNFFNEDNGLFVGFTPSDTYNSARTLILKDGTVNHLKPKLNLYFLKYE